jgi:hypothetical protein
MEDDPERRVRCVIASYLRAYSPLEFEVRMRRHVHDWTHRDWQTVIGLIRSLERVAGIRPEDPPSRAKDRSGAILDDLPPSPAEPE